MTYLTVQNLTVSNYLLETPIFESDLKLKKENDLDFYHLARMTILSRSIWILKDGWCIVIRTMLPPLAISFTFSTTLYALVESRPEVGSSRNSRDGLWIMSMPIDTLRRSPPETPRIPSSPMYVWAVVCYLTSSMFVKKMWRIFSLF